MTRLGAFVALVMVAGPSLARDPWTGIEDRRDMARARAASRLGDGCPSHRRNAHAKASFRKRFPCPSTGRYSGACPGWIVDHIVALKHCGRDREQHGLADSGGRRMEGPVGVDMPSLG